jgi:concentrative nucleoside transporter, CNT family
MWLFIYSVMRFLLLLIIAHFSILGNDAFSNDAISKIAKKWEIITESDTTSLSIFKDNRRFEFNQSGHVVQGDWSLKDSLLILSFDLPAFSAGIDSIRYEVDQNSPLLRYFSGGEEILRQSQSQLEMDRPVKVYRIAVIAEDRLVLQDGEERLEFFYEAPVVYESSFSAEGFFRGLLGLFSLLLIAFILSSKRSKINWMLVLKGILLQIVFAILVLKIPFVQTIFEGISNVFVGILNFTKAGSSFVFGGFVTDINSYGFIFAFQVLPTIVFFSALTSLLFYLGIIQKIVYGFAWIMNRLMNLSGAESLAAAGNIFLGQTEAPLLIKPYIEKMTKSEILCLMSGGMATIAGGVLAAYIGFLGGDDPEQQLFFAKHLIIASVLSAPAAIVAAKILLPETEDFDKKLEVTKEKIGENVLESISIGTVQGLKLAVNVGAMLIVFIAFIAMANYFFSDILGKYTGLNDIIASNSNGQYSGLTLQFMLGYILKPIAWLMGTSWADSALVGQLLGEKTILNEFVAYVTLGNLKAAGLFTEEKSIIIATYILCGFSNFSSIGIQIGGIGTLAPSKRTLLSQLGIKALIAGTLASLFTAVIIGMLI